jgi:hypothetical protein
VPVRTVSSLVSEGALPPDIGILKIDTEGFDLEVIRGLETHAPTVVLTEFWGEDFLFARHQTGSSRPVSATDIIAEMRQRKYHWHLIFFRIEGEYVIRLASSFANAPRKAWGNIVFFCNYQIFQEAFTWCRAALPRMYTAGPDATSGLNPS